jgi:hypothetical protein
MHTFQSVKTPTMFGFTIDHTGANLPIDGGPWEKAGATIPLGATMASTSPEIAQQVETTGYALVKGHSDAQPQIRKTESTP